MTYKHFGRLGWRARIGVITAASGAAIIADFHKIAPEGVALLLNGVAEPLTQDTVEQLSRVGDFVEDASKSFIQSKANVILWNTMTGSLMKGYGYDKELIKRIEEVTKIPATTAATTMIAALNKLGIKKLCFSAPYIDEVNERIKKFLEANGFTVLRYKGLQLLDIRDIIDCPAYALYQITKEVALPEADGIFISCAGLSVIDILEMLEHDIGKPVLSTNQAAFWGAFQMAKIKEPIQGYGKLLREP